MYQEIYYFFKMSNINKLGEASIQGGDLPEKAAKSCILLVMTGLSDKINILVTGSQPPANSYLHSCSETWYGHLSYVK